jgi:hypothetical protein
VQRSNQFRREQITTRLTGNEHKGFWLHRLISTQRSKVAKAQRKSLPELRIGYDGFGRNM